MSAFPDAPDPVQALRAQLRHALVEAMKARDADAVDALRSLAAAIDNGEAIAEAGSAAPASSTHVAGARPGVRSTEATRRDLPPDELRRIVDGEITGRRREADRYDALDRPADAARLRRQATVLAAWVERLPER
jgi:uncharacterized protein YqeY